MIDQLILAQDAVTTATDAMREGATNVGDASKDVYNTTMTVLAGLWESVSKFIGAAIILLIGYVAAKLFSGLLQKALSKTSFDHKLGGYLGAGPDSNVSAEKVISKFVFYLIMIIAFVAALKSAGLSDEVVAPFTGMLEKFFGAIPNIIQAALLLIITIILAKVARAVLSRILDATKLDQRIGTGEGKPVATAITTIVFWLIILMMLPTVFNSLKLDAIAGPLVQITEDITGYFPKVLGGAAIIAVGYLLGSIAQKIIYSLLNAIGFDSLPSKIGYEGEIKTQGVKSPSSVVSYIVMVSIIVLASAQAFATMELGSISEMAGEFQEGFFGILGGVIILGIGIFVANWVAGLLDDRSGSLAKVAKIAIIVFASAMAISQADIAPEISQTLFIAIIIAGAFAVGVGGAIALGLGGRERAKEVVDKLGK